VSLDYIDVVFQSPDPGKSNRKSKTSPSIKSFFQSKEPEEEDNESVNKQDIKKFFMPQRKVLSHEKPIKAQTCLIQDSDSDEFSTCNTDDRANSESSRISHLDVEEYQAVKSKAHKTPTATKKQEERDGSLKKVKQKWSLSWRVSKKSKKYKDSGSDSDFEDVTGLDRDKQESKVGIKKERRKQGKSETNEVESCSETKSKAAVLKNEEGKGKKGIKQKAAEREIPEATTKKKGNYEVKEKNNQKEKDEQSLKKRTKTVVLENKGIVDVLEVKESKTTPTSQSIPSSSPNNQVKSAFDVLMNQPKIHVAVDDECDKSVILVPTDEDVCKVESIMDKEKYPQNSSSSSSGCGNAFDILMTKKNPNNGDGEISKKSPQKSKHNSSKFKLSIHYSKPLKFDDKSDDDDDDDDTSPVIHETVQQTSTVHTCRKNTKTKQQDSKVLQKKSEDVGDDIKSTQARKKRKSKTDSESKSSIVKTPKDKKRTNVVNITDTPEETFELVEEQSEMTRVKKKKKKSKTKTAESSSKTTDTKNTPIEIQEDSNSSIQEIPVNDLPNKTPKTRSLSNKVIISPGSEDFEVTATRTGLRKRTNPKNYATMSEPVSLSSDDKKKKKDKWEKDQTVTIPDSPEVEMTCKATKKKREDEKTASGLNTILFYISDFYKLSFFSF
jgi:hypothetical protein